MKVTYLIWKEHNPFRYTGLFSFNVDLDRPRLPSECEWIVPGTGDDWS